MRFLFVVINWRLLIGGCELLVGNLYPFTGFGFSYRIIPVHQAQHLFGIVRNAGEARQLRVALSSIALNPYYLQRVGEHLFTALYGPETANALHNQLVESGVVAAPGEDESALIEIYHRATFAADRIDAHVAGQAELV